MTKVGKKVRNKHKILNHRPDYMKIFMIGYWNRCHRQYKFVSWEYRYNRIIKESKRRNYLMNRGDIIAI